MGETMVDETDWNAVTQVAGAHATSVAVQVTNATASLVVPAIVEPIAREAGEAAARAVGTELVAPFAQAAQEAADQATASQGAATQSETQAAASRDAAMTSAGLAAQSKAAAQTAKSAADGAAAISQANASTSAQARALAEQAALQAGNAASLASATSNIFVDVAAGLAATAEGATFAVQGAGDVLTTVYRKTGGNAVFVNQSPSKVAIDKVAAKFGLDDRATRILQLADQFGFALEFIAYLSGGLQTKTFQHNVPGGPADDAWLDQNGFARAVLRDSSFQAFGVKLASTNSVASISAADGRGLNLEGARFVEQELPPGVNLAVTDPLGFGMLSIGARGIVANVMTPNAPEPVPIRVPNLAPLYAASVFLLPGQKMTLYPRNLFRLRSDAAYAEVTFDSGSYVVTALGDGELVIDADRCGSTGTLTIARRDVEDLNRLSIALTIRKALPAGQTPRLLMIGDSITNRQQGVLTRTVLASVGINPVYIGTVPGTSGASSTTDSGGPMGEAREGRAYADYVYSALDGEAMPLPVGQETAYLAMSKADKLPYNPFLRAATGGDPADLVRNGYVFDFRFYLTRFAIPDPDILWLNLGENDIIENTTPAAAAASAADALSIVLAQARAAVPGMRIGVALSGQPSTPDGEVRWAKKAAVLETLISTVRALNDSLIYLVPTWAHVSPSAGWSRSAGTTDGLGVTASIVNDNIHPIGSARQQIADATAAFIAFAAS